MHIYVYARVNEYKILLLSIDLNVYQNPVKMAKSFISDIFFFSDDYGQKNFFSKTKFNVKADITNIKAEFVDEFDTMIRFKMASVSNNSRSF